MQSSAQAWRILLLGAVVASALPAAAASAHATRHAKAPALHGPLPKAVVFGHAGARATGAPKGTKIVAETGHRVDARGGTRVALRDGVFYYHAWPKFALRKNGKARYASLGRGQSLPYGDGGLQCVPFARAASGIELKGNAANWWEAASGVYQRGSAPEPGSVLNFRATGNMRLGHVAVVTNVLNAREIEIEHANWWGPGASKGGVSRGVKVVDVSANNDWTEVRVSLGQTGEFGSTYPTYGFIYDRPDSGVMEARATRVRDSRGAEVAEAPRR